MKAHVETTRVARAALPRLAMTGLFIAGLCALLEGLRLVGRTGVLQLGNLARIGSLSVVLGAAFVVVASIYILSAGLAEHWTRRLLGWCAAGRLRRKLPGIVVHGLVAASLMVPQAFAVSQTFEKIGKGTILGGGAFALCAAAVWLVLWRRRSISVPNAISAAGATGITLGLMTLDYSINKISGRVFSIQLYFFLVSAMFAPALYLILENLRSASFCRGWGPRIVRVALALGGLALGLWVIDTIPIQSKSAYGFVGAAIGAAFLLASTTTCAPRRFYGLAAIYLLGLAGHAVFFWWWPAPDPSSYWSLSESTLVSSDVFMSGAKRLEQEQDQLRAFRAAETYPRGREATADARRWNERPEPRSTTPQNILLITVDALRSDRVTTPEIARKVAPNISAFADFSSTFPNAYAQGGWTSISLPTLLWSKYARTIEFVSLYEDSSMRLHFHRGDIPKGKRLRLIFQSPKQEPTANIAAVLAEEGYTSYAVLNDGVTGYFVPKLGFARDFTEIVSLPRARRKAGLKGRHADEVVVAKTIDILENEPGKKLIWAHLFAPHARYVRHKEAPRELSLYDGEVYFADIQVGKILDYLSESSRLEETMVIIMGDHGEGQGEQGRRYHGGGLYDGQMKVPLVIHLPGTTGPERIEAPVGLIDVVPTILGAVNLPVPESYQGFSLLPFLDGKSGIQRPPIMMETWRRAKKTEKKVKDLVAIRDGDFKLIHSRITGAYALFDVVADPEETVNLLALSDDASYAQFLRLAGYLWGWMDANPSYEIVPTPTPKRRRRPSRIDRTTGRARRANHRARR